MTKMKSLLVALVFTAAFAVVPSATAQCPYVIGTSTLPCVHYMSAGSSAMYQGFGVSVVNEIAPALIAATSFPTGSTVTVHHFTTKGTSCGAGGCAAGGNAVSLVDNRDSKILPEQVTYWVAWVNCTGGSCGAAPGVDTDAWAYNQVDSTVGDRSFMAQGPKVVSNVGSLATATNNISSALFNGGTSDDTSIPADVYSAVNNHPITTGMTDIRAEDALFATARTNCNASGTPAAPWNCLGYQPNAAGDAHVALPIKSSYTSSSANPVDFGLPGTSDPITGTAVPTTIISIPVGEDPIVFFANRENASGLGYKSGGNYVYNNLTDNTGGLIGSGHGYAGGLGGVNWLGYMFAGNDCAGDNPTFGDGSSIIGKTGPSTNFAIHLMQREALSGTMNTTEFGAFDIFGGSLGAVDGSSVGNSNTLVPWTSQEANINPQNGAGDDPLSKNCAAAADGTTGTRNRVIGAGEMEKGSACPGGTGGVCNVSDSLGYNFWSFGNFSSVTSTSYGYLQLDGVDPLYPTYSQGAIPSCTADTNCDINSAFSGNPFPHLVDGTYRAWSLLRAYCDTAYVDPVTGGKHCTAAEDPYGTEGLIAYAQSDIGNSAKDSVADYLPFQDPEVGVLSGTTAFGLPGYGLTRYVRSHYVFNASVGIVSNENPGSHTDASSGWDGVLPISVTNGTIRDAGVPTNPGVTSGACLESGGDAGGAIIPIGGTCSSGSGNAGAACSANDQCTKGSGPNFCETATGQMVTAPVVLAISKYLVAPTNHLKFYYTQTCGTEPVTGVCTGGANNGTPCITSTATGAGAPAGATCTNLPGLLTTSCSSQAQYQPATGSGISMSVSTNGGTLPNTVNGVFQVTKIVANTAAGDSSSQIKVKMNPTTTSATNCKPYVGASDCSQQLSGTGVATISTGSSQ